MGCRRCIVCGLGGGACSCGPDAQRCGIDEPVVPEECCAYCQTRTCLHCALLTIPGVLHDDCWRELGRPEWGWNIAGVCTTQIAGQRSIVSPCISRMLFAELVTCECVHLRASFGILHGTQQLHGRTETYENGVLHGKEAIVRDCGIVEEWDRGTLVRITKNSSA